MRYAALVLFILSISCERQGHDASETGNDLETQDQAVIENAGPEPEPIPGTEVSPKPEDGQPPESQDVTIDLDASSTLETTYFKIENESLLKTTSDQPWLFAVKRTQFQTNSGTSGNLNIGVMSPETTDYESVTECQTGSLTYDEMLPASGAHGSQPYSGNALLNAWYNYDANTHTVSSKQLVYLISDGTTCAKFQIVSYASGLYKARFKVLARSTPIPDPTPTPTPTPTTAPEPDPEQTVDASSSTASVYLKLEQGKLAMTTSDQGWVMAVKRSQFQTNSGTSGPLNFGVMSLETTDYDSVIQCQTGSLTYDATLPASGAPGSQPYSGNALLNAWYNYDMTTHVISSKKLVYLISDGALCFKFQIMSYASGVYKVRSDASEIPSQAQPQVHEQTIDASSATATVYLKLDQGQLVPTTNDQPWLLAVKRTQFQTNSGTSGSRGVGVHSTGSTDFAALNSCSNLTYSYDEMLPASGAPGSQPYSGNAVLNAWYNYDTTTHTLSSKQHLYLFSDGTECLKLQILTYSSGIYSVKVSQL